jgi:hypothetical protein
LAVVIVWSLAPVLRRPGAEQFLATQLLTSHALIMVDHLTDVATDQRTVKPWFDGKRFCAWWEPGKYGFLWSGGRLDYLDNRPVAALVTSGASISLTFSFGGRDQ